MKAEIVAKPYAEFMGGKRVLSIVTKAGERAVGKNMIGDVVYRPFGVGDLLLVGSDGNVVTGPVGVADVFGIASAILHGHPRAITDPHAINMLAMYAVFALGRPARVVPEGAANAEHHQAQDEIATSFGDGDEP